MKLAHWGISVLMAAANSWGELPITPHAKAGELGRLEEGRAALQRLLAIQPGFSIAWQHALLSVPLRHNLQAVERYLEGSRRVGVPEGPSDPARSPAPAVP
jgi:hypothetical protein